MKRFLLGFALVLLAACGDDDSSFAPRDDEPMSSSSENVTPQSSESEASVSSSSARSSLLQENREMLDKIAGYLFQKETITGAQMMAILEGRNPDLEEYYGVKAERDQSIEAPAKHIAMISEPISAPETPEKEHSEETNTDSSEELLSDSNNEP